MDSLDFFSDHLQTYLDELQALTALETPTGNLANLQRAADFLAHLLAPLGHVERCDLQDHGPLLRLRRQGIGSRILLLGHYDTVWPIGSWGCRWNISHGRASGPGVYDMKGGLLFIPWLLRYLDTNSLAHPEIEVLLNPDEEIGSVGSRSYIEEAARQADFVLVLEPSNLDGGLKVARKGSGEYVITVRGRSSHQGAEPEKGINAVIEAAHQVISLSELENPAAGTTLGPNVISGGSVSNSVPDFAEIRVDVRAWTREETERLDRALRGLRPFLAGADIHVLGGWNRPPMETSPPAVELYERARGIARGLGFDLGSLRWGGSSDANLTASVGTPTVDGFGPVGEGAHQVDECIVVDAIPGRLALLAELVTSLALPVEEWLGAESQTWLARRNSLDPGPVF
jgi:glutamate carboxypeptidase